VTTPFLSIQCASACRGTSRRTWAVEGLASTTAERERPPSRADCVAAVHCRGASPAWPQQRPPAADLLCQYRAATGGKENKSERGRKGKRRRGVPLSPPACRPQGLGGLLQPPSGETETVTGRIEVARVCQGWPLGLVLIQLCARSAVGSHPTVRGERRLLGGPWAASIWAARGSISQ
jgi:hypothetical protein